ncbi:hypothetical protein F53441_9216 [Fusarium austroafricanum]|uniref:NACHT domain-containing protein n=1 Tax=Fusarium austroafricanum TaxID=2364996 RepID=A0A8H4KCA1_9HYPO|nr:hypothetical protein F53441_9216 [Fusarium austroafricanum]
MTSTVIDHLGSTFGHDLDIGIAYIYCNFQRHDQQNLDELFASLLKQLAANMSPLPEFVMNLYASHQNKRSHPIAQEILDALQKTISRYSRVFVVIDALDEYGMTGSSRENFLTQLGQLQEQYEINVFMTSRFNTTIDVEVDTNFKHVRQLEIRADGEEIARYIESRLNALPSAIKNNPTLRKDIIKRISNSVKGMFLLANIYLNLLSHKVSETEILNQLAAFEEFGKSESERGMTAALNKAYSQTMDRINQQESSHATLAKKVLFWTAHARRELTIKELQHALATSSAQREVCDADLPFEETMVAVCAGLVSVDMTGKIIQLAHYTVQEYIYQKSKELLPATKEDIARTCIAYLSFSSFAPHLSDRRFWLDPAWQRFQQEVQPYPFYHYAATNWGHHTCESSISDDEVLEALDSDIGVMASTMALTANSYIIVSVSGVTKLHVAAHFGLEQVVGKLLSRESNPDPRDTIQRTPLCYAAEQGHDEVVKLLIGNGADTDPQGARPTPLSLATEGGHVDVVQTLLNSQDAGTSQSAKTGISNWWALSIAAHFGYESNVRLLLEKGADPNANIEPDMKDPTDMWREPPPLSRAANAGHKDIVELLLLKGADPDQRALKSTIYYHGITPLSFAAARGHEEIVHLLLRRGVDVDSEGMSGNCHGRTPLSFAAHFGHLSIVKLLLAEGADPNSEAKSVTIRGRTPLSYASISGHESIVQLLIANWANVQSKSRSARTPLSHAAEYGRKGIVQMLLQTEQVEPDWAHKDGRTPFSYAAENGYTGVIQMLLHTEQVEPDFADENGRTPLSYAAEHGHVTTAQLLLERGVDVDSICTRTGRWNDGTTPLMIAAERNHEDIVRLLIKNGADIGATDATGMTALSWARMHGCEEVQRVLMEVKKNKTASEGE